MYLYVYKCAKVISKNIPWWFSNINIINEYMYIYICDENQHQQELSYFSDKRSKIPLLWCNQGNHPVITIYGVQDKRNRTIYGNDNVVSLSFHPPQPPSASVIDVVDILYLRWDVERAEKQ